MNLKLNLGMKAILFNTRFDLANLILALDRVRFGWRFKMKKMRLRIAGKRRDLAMSAMQREAISITIGLINKPESVLFEAPITKKMYIHSGNFFVIIDYKNVTIQDNAYPNSFALTEKQDTYLTKRFKRRLNRIALEWEAEIQTKMMVHLKEMNKVIHDSTKHS